MRPTRRKTLDAIKAIELAGYAPPAWWDCRDAWATRKWAEGSNLDVLAKQDGRGRYEVALRVNRCAQHYMRAFRTMDSFGPIGFVRREVFHVQHVV